jgi:hypothetical protein
MKLIRILLISAVALLAFSSVAAAKDFGWTRNFNKVAKSDPPQFRTKMAERFDLSDVQVLALRNIFASPADAYIMLRLGEMQDGGLRKLSKEKAIAAVNTYRGNRDKGWNALAKMLGVEMESKEFIALKSGHDLDRDAQHDQVAYTGHDGSKERL